jgi:cobalt-zinc-cadmium efflux system membrane fusion protein
MKKQLLIPVILLAVLAACKGRQPESVNRTGFMLSDTMMQRIHLDTVRIRQVTGTLLLNGKITTEKGKMVEVFPVVGGTAVQVNADLGDYKQKGDVLAVIRSGEVAEFERQLIDARSDLLLAEKNVKVQTDLFNSNLVSEKELLQSKEELDKANAELSRIRELYSIYHLRDHSEYEIKAPISGFITDKTLSNDMTIRADNSDHLFTIAEIDRVWVVANVFESDIAKVQPGMDAEVTTLSYPDKKFFGKVDKILSVLDPDTKTMSIRITLDNPEYLLKPEMVAMVKLHMEEPESMPAIPSDAVIFDKNKNYVMVYHDRANVETREVAIYRATDDETYVTHGLHAGDIIISRNQLFVYDELND